MTEQRGGFEKEELVAGSWAHSCLLNGEGMNGWGAVGKWTVPGWGRAKEMLVGSEFDEHHHLALRSRGSWAP